MASFNNRLTVVFAMAAVAHASATQTGSKAMMQKQVKQLTVDPPDPASDTLHSLDTNGDGRVDFSEVASFAKEKGLDYTDTLQEFSAFDADHNGLLDAREVARALGTSPSAGQLQPQPQQRPAAPQMAEGQSSADGRWQKGSGVFNGGGAFAVSPQASQVLPPQPAAGQSSSAASSFSAGVASIEARQAMLAKVSAAMSLETDAEHKAAALESKAAEKRSQLASLRGSVEEKAQESGQTAAKAMAEELLHTLQQMDKNATRMEVAAAAIKVKSKAEMQYAEFLSSAASEALADSKAVRQA